ncbi:MAG: toll/interleukin-1 receptor domain-containing protein, partial [Oscillospiraceae bacterium]|nr:toll/interleukin-1 receptor domain-containing protein [Oscillospiraceae bacterium]
MSTQEEYTVFVSFHKSDLNLLGRLEQMMRKTDGRIITMLGEVSFRDGSVCFLPVSEDFASGKKQRTLPDLIGESDQILLLGTPEYLRDSRTRTEAAEAAKEAEMCQVPVVLCLPDGYAIHDILPGSEMEFLTWHYSGGLHEKPNLERLADILETYDSLSVEMGEIDYIGQLPGVYSDPLALPDALCRTIGSLCRLFYNGAASRGNSLMLCYCAEHLCRYGDPAAFGNDSQKLGEKIGDTARLIGHLLDSDFYMAWCKQDSLYAAYGYLLNSKLRRLMTASAALQSCRTGTLPDGEAMRRIEQRRSSFAGMIDYDKNKFPSVETCVAFIEKQFTENLQASGLGLNSPKSAPLPVEPSPKPEEPSPKPVEPSPAPDGFDVFLSYKHEDEDTAEGVFRFLKGSGLRPFLDKISLPEIGIAEYDAAIMDALDRSKHFIVVISDLEYLKSDWISLEMSTFNREMKEGRKPGGNFLLLVTEDVYRQITASNKRCLNIKYRGYEIMQLNDYRERIL